MAKKSKEEPIRGIIVLFTLAGLKKVCHATKTTIAVYGKDVALADTIAMDKILIALAKRQDSVII